ncbi:MAG: methionine synthase [Actinomycetia bacterium]|nr:methionine synthase [Actinomycetes bacterium]
MIRATGMGSWPGTDPREAIVTVRDLLSEGDGTAIPYLPETPARGPGADLIGRGAGVLTDLPVETQPSGWRLADRPGRDAERTASLWRADLDELAEAYDGYSGPLKVAVAGPWTLAASIELPRGERVLTDLGAAQELAASLADGLGVLVARLARLVPGAEIIVQLDEPSLPAVLAGELPTASGYGRVRAVAADQVVSALQEVTGSLPGQTLIHCCHPSAPIPVLRRSGADALALDLTAASDARWESVAATLEEGVGLYAGLLVTEGASLGSTGVAADLVVQSARRLLEQSERVGIDPALLAGIVVSPACGLAGAGRDGAIAIQRATLDLAAELTDRLGSAP